MAVEFDEVHEAGYAYMSKHNPNPGYYYEARADLYICLSKDPHISDSDCSFYDQLDSHPNIGSYFGWTELDRDHSVTDATKHVLVMAYEESSLSSYFMNRTDTHFFRNTRTIIKDLSFALAYVHSKNLLFTGLKYSSSYIYYPEHNLVKISLKTCYPIGSVSARKHTIKTNYADLVYYLKSFLQGDLCSSLQTVVSMTTTIPRYPCYPPEGTPNPNTTYLRAYVEEISDFLELLIRCDSATEHKNHPLFWPPRIRLLCLQDIFNYANGTVFDVPSSGGEGSTGSLKIAGDKDGATVSGKVSETVKDTVKDDADNSWQVVKGKFSRKTVKDDATGSIQIGECLAGHGVAFSDANYAICNKLWVMRMDDLIGDSKAWSTLPLPATLGLKKCHGGYHYLKTLRNILSHVTKENEESDLLESFRKFHADTTMGMDLCLSYYFPKFFMSVYRAAKEKVSASSSPYLSMYFDPKSEWE